ncbi:MAG TPA: energy-dependent translational throttle protein EttA [Candidatus Rifleibacterium sp.]|jgi:ATP-binding cassette ChvD family protein|nr:energy-dependent translational throttle protein EttA [Candidatus Ozemobacteraceae bacterium]HOI89869.1 energy-dependent translational throttle protein EttA [Candidatus Rifleibacterium sp.]HPW58660.1 energy-dependent translational throttle protein EttA [Candidatus Rifleibacterium sp.]
MADKYIFTMLGLNKFYGTRQVLKDINLCFFPGAKIGIVGANGAGKSTVLRIMAGIDKEFRGQAELTKGYKVGFVPQEPKLEEGKTVRQNIEAAFADTLAMIKEYEDISAAMGEMDPDAMDKAMEKMAQLQDKIDAAGGWEIDTRLNVAANALVLPPDDMIVDNLSGGEKRRVALCRALLEEPDLLLLDEPTNHLDAQTVAWLENYLKDYPGTVIISTHDRYFLDNITKWILELEDGHGIPFEGNYSSWLAQKLQILAASEKKESARRRSLERELKWIRMNTGDRHELQRERLAHFEDLVAREKSADRGDETVIQIAPAEHLGDLVVEFKGVSKAYDGNKLMENVTFSLPKGAVVGIIGPNGAGKTTMFRMIGGVEKPDNGEVVVGPTVKAAWVDQHREILSGDKTVFDEISDGLDDVQFGKMKIPSRAYCGRFGFKGSDQQKKVGELSGGERNRVHLAKIVKSGGNLLMLDEPTNDLDVGTLRLLEDAISDFAGCALVISHDRFFLNRICTHLLVFEGNSKVSWFEGNFEDYESMYLKKLGAAANDNRRAKFRRFAL